jgi:hypothetical protein
MAEEFFKMKKRLLAFNLALLSCIFFVSGNSIRAQDKAIEQIRRMAEELDAKIKLSEQGAEDSAYAGIVSNELVVNRNEHVWPAVGNYQATYKFYYDNAQTEGHHYPDRLRKVVMKSKLSDRSYYAEYLFNEAGALVFYYAKPDEPQVGNETPPVEQRLYFSGGRLIRIIKAQTTSNQPTAPDFKFAGKILTASRQLKEFFAKSLNLPE